MGNTMRTGLHDNRSLRGTITRPPKPIWTLLVLFSGLCQPASAEVCPDAVVNGDQLYWNYMAGRVWSLWDHRDYLMEYYDLSESDWDGGWGVHKLDDPNPHQYALPKMMNAMDYMAYELDDTPKFQGAWLSRQFGSSGTGTRLSALSRSIDSIELFGRRDDDMLAYTVMWAGNRDWLPGELSPSRQSYLIHLRNDKGRVPMHGSPAALSRGLNSLDVFYRSDRELIYARWASAATDTVEFPTLTVNWTVGSLTELFTRPAPVMGQVRYFISTDPVTITRDDGTLDVFAIDDTADNLIHYSWTPASGWSAEDVSEIAGGTRPFREDPVVINREASRLDLFIADELGHLLRFAWSTDSGWTREDVTEALGDEYSIDSKPVIISRSADSLDVFARAQVGNLLHFRWTSAAGWQVDNLTDALDAEPIDGQPTVLERTNFVHVFARGYTWRSLIHFYWTEAGGWATEDLTAGDWVSSLHRVDGDPVATGADDRVDVYARNSAGQLVHYYWTPFTSWLAENVHHGPGISASFNLVEHDPLIVVPRRENVSDVIGTRSLGSVYFTSATGLSLNANPWHSSAEYSRWAAGSRHQFEYQPEFTDPSSNDGAEAHWGPLWDDRVDMYCASFDAQAYPALRAAWMLHESTHMNYHQEHDQVNGQDVDPWLHHGLLSPAGGLTGGVPAEGSNYVLTPTHTPYQLTVEALCDFFEMSNDDVPPAAYQGADTAADFYMTATISNPPAWSCGMPRPLY